MIHYHGCPLSGGDESQMAFSGKHAMISFAGQHYHELIIELCQSFVLDNGAFSAWTAGKKFDIEGFAEWVNVWYRHPSFDWYAIPDVIDGDHNDNARMRAKWFKMVDRSVWDKGYPVWHMHEPVEVLRDLGRAFSGVCLGSSGEYAQVGTKQWWARMAEALPHVTDDQGRPTTNLHGLRMLDPTIYSHLPLKSADSTNVGRNIGIDTAWKGPYQPATKKQRALVMMDRIESHASAKTFNPATIEIEQNFELCG